MPENILWISILSGFESCTDFQQVQNMIAELAPLIPPLKERKTVEYSPESDTIDKVAQAEIPHDGPTQRKAILTDGDGNCLSRSVSKGYFNSDCHHAEIRVRIVIEAVINMDKYLIHECLERGATYIHKNADLPTVFATFSEFYTPGQKLTNETIQSIYCMEAYSCSRLGSYMGLWQLAQTSSALGIPLHTIYPVRGESGIRNDFNRMFFPVNYNDTDNEPIVIMWTGLQRGSAPIHFIPLIPE